MTKEEGIITGSIYSECYEIARKETKNALKSFIVPAVDKKDMLLEHKNIEGSLIYKLYIQNEKLQKLLISTATVNIETREVEVIISNLTESENSNK